MDSLSKSFTYYRKSANIEKKISLKKFKKDVFVMGKSCYRCRNKSFIFTFYKWVLKEFYLDRILSPIEEAEYKIKIFDNFGWNLKVQMKCAVNTTI
jgi:G:T-mismatch repair DNA endonuclease (very short patch repair protein)